MAVLDGPATAFAWRLGGRYARHFGHWGSSALWAWPQFRHTHGWGQLGTVDGWSRHWEQRCRWAAVAWLPAQCMHRAGALQAFARWPSAQQRVHWVRVWRGMNFSMWQFSPRNRNFDDLLKDVSTDPVMSTKLIANAEWRRFGFVAMSVDIQLMYSHS